MDFNKLAFVDVETSGSSVGNDRVIEIGIIRVEDNRVVHRINTLLNPESYVSPYIEYMTGISAADLVDAPKFEDKKDEIFEILEDCIFIAHNVRFDYGFIREEFKRYNRQFMAQCLCTVKLSRQLYPTWRSHNLDSLISHFNLECARRHRAYDDAHVLWQFYQHIQTEFSLKNLTSIYQTICKKPSLPPHLSKEIINGLPESPGIYIFYDKQRIPLYVGKSKNIKDRVLSHFLTVFDSDKEMEMAQQVHDIEYRGTVGELGALLLESELVKQLQPYYNRSLKKKEEIVVITRAVSDEGYFTPHIEVTAGVIGDELSTVLGFFKNKQKAKDFLQRIVKDHNLCSKLLQLEKTKNSCFNHKINICFGACIGKESSESYNQRFLQAFETKKIADWGYKSPILIEEVNKREHTVDGYVFDNWRHIATIQSVDDTTSVSRNNYKYFDMDVYHILKTYLKNKPKVKFIPYPQVEELLTSF